MIPGLAICIFNMGCTALQLSGLNELCYFIPGLLVDKNDDNLYYSLCTLREIGVTIYAQYTIFIDIKMHINMVINAFNLTSPVHFAFNTKQKWEARTRKF